MPLPHISKDIVQTADGMLSEEVGQIFHNISFFDEQLTPDMQKYVQHIAKNSAIVTIAALVGSGDLHMDFEQAASTQIVAGVSRHLIREGVTDAA